jgi:hypothetical protein
MLGFPSGIFPLLMLSHLSRTTITSGRLRLEGVASGYWPPPAKRSSGLAATRVRVPRPRSHSTGINLLDNSAAGVILKLLRRRRTAPNIEAPDDYRGLCYFEGSSTAILQVR